MDLSLAIHENWSTVDLILFFAPKVGFAVVCGGVIGVERELRSKSAGIKTNILICLGASLYTGISALMWSLSIDQGVVADPARIAAQIVSGIGFLGAGTIIQSRGTVYGLTTAANIWVVAALGVMVGMGHGILATGISGVVVLILILTSFLEERFLRRARIFSVEVLLEDSTGQIRRDIKKRLEDYDLNIQDVSMIEQGENVSIRLKYQGSHQDHKRFMIELWTTQGVRTVK
jgi:putative Mg2+ transporter-C (MgtC) family protein